MPEPSASPVNAPENAAPSAAPESSTAPKSKPRSKSQPGVYQLPAAAHQALRYAALIIAFENEGNEKEHITADQLLLDAVARHLVVLQKEGVRFTDKITADLVKAKLLKA